MHDNCLYHYFITVQEVYELQTESKDTKISNEEILFWTRLSKFHRQKGGRRKYVQCELVHKQPCDEKLDKEKRKSYQTVSLEGMV